MTAPWSSGMSRQVTRLRSQTYVAYSALDRDKNAFKVVLLPTCEQVTSSATWLLWSLEAPEGSSGESVLPQPSWWDDFPSHLLLSLQYLDNFQLQLCSAPQVCAVGSRNGTEETKLMVLDFDAEAKWWRFMQITRPIKPTRLGINMKIFTTPLQEIFLVWNGCTLGARDNTRMSRIWSFTCSTNILLQTYFSWLLAILIHFVRATVDHWVTNPLCLLARKKFRQTSFQTIGNFLKPTTGQAQPHLLVAYFPYVATVW